VPTYQFEAMDRTGQEIKDVIEAQTEEEATTTIRQMGYFVTRISMKKGAEKKTAGGKKKRPFALGGARTKHICTFTRQLSILQDAGLPILRSLKILEGNQKGGKLKNALMDVCDEIESGSTLSEGMAKCPKVFNRLYVNMVKAGEAGGALEVILQRLSDFLERSESLKRVVKGALIYPIAVVFITIGILVFIMMKIVPTFKKMFDEFGFPLPAITQLLMAMSDYVVNFWFLLVAIPVAVWMVGKLIRKFKHGRMGYDMYILKLPVFGALIEKNILARTTRTLGTLVASGVPILDALNITRETAGNALFEKIFSKVTEAIREGDVISKPMKQYSTPGFHPLSAFYWAWLGAFPGIMVMSVALTAGRSAGKGKNANTMSNLIGVANYMLLVGTVLCILFYLLKMNKRVIDDLVVNMVDVGEETGELDTMLYKVADTYDEEVRVMTEGLTRLIEPILIVFLGFAVGFIVIALFLPLITMITELSSG
jgi:type IV pilus assembly protein PilC